MDVTGLEVKKESIFNDYEATEKILDDRSQSTKSPGAGTLYESVAIATSVTTSNEGVIVSRTSSSESGNKKIIINFILSPDAIDNLKVRTKKTEIGLHDWTWIDFKGLN